MGKYLWFPVKIFNSSMNWDTLKPGLNIRQASLNSVFPQLLGLCCALSALLATSRLVRSALRFREMGKSPQGTWMGLATLWVNSKHSKNDMENHHV